MQSIAGRNHDILEAEMNRWDRAFAWAFNFAEEKQTAPLLHVEPGGRRHLEPSVLDYRPCDSCGQAHEDLMVWPLVGPMYWDEISAGYTHAGALSRNRRKDILWVV